MHTAAGMPRGMPPVSAYTEGVTGFDCRATSIMQDRDGALYFGGFGLISFDGSVWRIAGRQEFSLYREIAPDSAGRLWSATGFDVGWFERDPNLAWRFRSVREKLPGTDGERGIFWSAHVDAHGPVFVTEKSVLRWTGEGFRIWRLPTERRLFPVRVGQTLYVQSLVSGLYRIDESGPVLIFDQAVIGDHAILWLEQRPDGWLFAANAGLFHCDGQVTRPVNTDLGGYLRTHRVSCGVRLRDGGIALGTLSGGVLLLGPEGNLMRTIRVDDGLPANAVSDLKHDRDGLLWVATERGIASIGVNSASEILDTRIGLPRHSIRTLAQWQDRLLVLSESGASISSAADGRFADIADLPGRWHGVHTTQERVVLGGFRTFRSWDGSVAVPFVMSDGDGYVLAARRADPAQLYVSELRRILVGDGVAPARIAVADLPTNAASIAEDETGRLWLGSYGAGVMVAKPLPDGPAMAVAAAAQFGLPTLPGYVRTRALGDGTVLVFADSGAWVRRPGSANFRPVASYPVRKLAAVAEAPDAENGFWLVHAGTEGLRPTVARVTIGETSCVWEPHEVAGLPPLGSPGPILATRDAAAGTVLWIGGTHGILRHAVGAAPSAPAPRAPLLHGYVYPKTGDERRLVGETLPYSARAVVFELATADYARRDQLRLETRIDGIDTGWISPGADARRELTAIRDGRYTVRARVVAATGAASPETVLAFTVLPPWWRTWPAALGLVAVLVPAGYGAYRLRIRALRRRNAELEAKVRERTEALEQASAAKTQFVANMSHDIRNPLNGIVGLALALEDSQLDRRQREIVATLRECTTYLSSLVDDVLDFASIEAGKIELRPGPFVPEELLRSIATTLRADTADRGATLLIRTDPALPTRLLGDAGRIQQILVNYVSNALKYAGGTIELAATRPAGAPGEIEFSVRDRGPGIAPAEQATLFTKFTRLRRAEQADIAGAGLGLAACRLLADHLGGSVGVDSRPGDGARFFLRLPLEVAAGPVAADPAALPNTTVLLVEDTDYNAWAAAAVLARLGLTCDRARTGEEALRLFSDRRYNVVLLDRNLPDMDGTDVARRLRELEGDAAPAVILAVTAYCTAEDRQLCLASGMDDFVGKPLTPEKLRRALVDAGRRLLASASVRTEPSAPAPAPLAAPADGGVDLSMLGYLAESDPAGLDHQIDRFLATLDEARTELAAAQAARDFGRLGLAAHRLVGQARIIGSDALAESALAIEAAARTGDAAACAAGLTRADAGMAAVTAAMRRRPQPVPTA